MVLGGWTLLVALRRAEDGYEDALGFSAGILPALPIAALQPKAALGVRGTRPAAPATAASQFSTGTTTQSVTIFVSSNGRTASPLYRRYRRSGASASPFPTQSASPFPTQSASPFPIQSASPFPVQSASPFPTGSASPFPTGSASPFEMSCATNRAQANPDGSAPPFPSSTKPASGDRPAS